MSQNTGAFVRRINVLENENDFTVRYRTTVFLRLFFFFISESLLEK